MLKLLRAAYNFDDYTKLRDMLITAYENCHGDCRNCNRVACTDIHSTIHFLTNVINHNYGYALEEMEKYHK